MVRPADRDEAVKSTRFGTTRLDQEYGDMRVKASDYGGATVRGVELSDVPRAVTVSGTTHTLMPLRPMVSPPSTGL